MDNTGGFYDSIKICRACDLRGNCFRTPTAGPGPSPRAGTISVMLVTDHPDYQDQATGNILSGNVGSEFDRIFYKYHNQTYNPITIFKTSLTRCPPDLEKKKRITPNQIQTCYPYLHTEISLFRPHVIIALGNDAAQKFSGELNYRTVESRNGLFHPMTFDFQDGPPLTSLVVPVVHPKTGMGMSSKAIMVVDGLKGAANTIKTVKQLGVKILADQFKVNRQKEESACNYAYLSGFLSLPPEFPSAKRLDGMTIIALDTETTADGQPWCVSASVASGHANGRAVVIPAPKPGERPCLALKQLIALFSRGRTNSCAAVMHNALFDIPVLHRMGFHVPGDPSRPLFGHASDQAVWHDTMIMADILQNEPRGLKDLTWKHTGLPMSDFEDTISESGADKELLNYIKVVSETKFPSCKPVREKKWNKATLNEEIKYRQPQNISKAAARILQAYSNPKQTKAVLEGEPPPTLAELWNDIPWDEGRGMAQEKFGRPPFPDVTKISKARLVTYSGRDADATLRLFGILHHKLESNYLIHTWDLDNKSAYLVQQMTAGGIRLDIPKLESLKVAFQSELCGVRDELAGLTGNRFNPESSNQCAAILYKKYSMPVQSSGDRLVSTDDKALTKLQKYYERLDPEGTNPKISKYLKIISLIMDHREIDQLLTMFIIPLLRLVSPDGFIRADLKICGTETGRMTSSKPNLLAIPAHTKRGKMVKSCFLPDNPDHVMLNRDYSQLELKILAGLSGDPILVAAYTKGLDIHAITAGTIYGIPPEKVSKEQRSKAKTINFGIIYGLGAPGLSEQLQIPKAEAQHMIDSYFKTYPTVKTFMAKTLDDYRKRDAAVDWFGRRRWLPNLSSSVFRLKSDAERQGFNALIQSTAAGITKRAMVNILPHTGSNFRPLLQIHDALLFSVHKDKAQQYSELLGDCMSSVCSLPNGVPLTSDAGTGPNWAELEK